MLPRHSPPSGNHNKCKPASSFCAVKGRNVALGEETAVSVGGGDASDNGGDAVTMAVMWVTMVNDMGVTSVRTAVVVSVMVRGW